MNTEEHHPTLARILDANINEYIHLMACNKKAISRTLIAHCNSIINVIRKYQGQFIDT